MRACLLTLVFFLASGTSAQETPCEDCPQEGDVIKVIEWILDEPSPSATEPAQPCVPGGFDAQALLVPEPGAWIPLATQLFGCSPESIALLGLGSEEIVGQIGDVSTYDYVNDLDGRHRSVFVMYGASGALSVNLLLDSPADATPDFFETMLEQVREIVGADMEIIRDGLAMGSISADVPYMVMLDSGDDTISISVIREEE